MDGGSTRTRLNPLAGAAAGERLTALPVEVRVVHRRRLVQGLTATFGGMSLLLALVGVAINPAVLVLALVFGVVTALLWYHASGRLASRVYRRVERRAAGAGHAKTRGGVGAGPKDTWRGPHRRRSTAGRARGGGVGREAEERQAGSAPPRQAYEILGLEPGADEAAIRRAYREQIKEVHPDTDGGTEAAFKRVRHAYDLLSD